MARAALLFAALLVVGCGGEPEPLEARVRALVAEAEASAEARDVDALMDLVVDDYRGPRGEPKSAVAPLARFALGRHQTVHLLTRISDVEVRDSTQARATVFVAMGGRPIQGPEELEALRGSLWRFEVLVRRDDGEVQVTQAQWRRARPDDFL